MKFKRYVVPFISSPFELSLDVWNRNVGTTERVAGKMCLFPLVSKAEMWNWQSSKSMQGKSVLQDWRQRTRSLLNFNLASEIIKMDKINYLHSHRDAPKERQSLKRLLGAKIDICWSVAGDNPSAFICSGLSCCDVFVEEAQWGWWYCIFLVLKSQDCVAGLLLYQEAVLPMFVSFFIVLVLKNRISIPMIEWCK